MTVEKCIYCDNTADTKEHIPSKCLINKPYPVNLLTVPSCQKCNSSFSKDEEYVMYLIDFLKSVELNEGDLIREKVKRTLNHSESLENRMFSSLAVDECNKPFFRIEYERVKKVLIKNAKGLYYHHFGGLLEDKVLTNIWFSFLPQMSQDQMRTFSNVEWKVIQDQEFRYAYDKDNKFIRMIINEFLYSEILIVVIL